jgi:hypothetical protein
MIPFSKGVQWLVPVVPSGRGVDTFFDEFLVVAAGANLMQFKFMCSAGGFGCYIPETTAAG